MKETNKNIFEEKIAPELEKVATHIRPGRWEDTDDIKQELKACALNFINWVEKKGQDITHPKAVVQRAARYVISGRRAFSQKTSDILHTHADDGNIAEYEDYRTSGTSINNPAVQVQRECDVEEVYRLLGKKNAEILDMTLCGYSNGQIAERYGMTEPQCSELRKGIQKTLKAWIEQDAQAKVIDESGQVIGIAEPPVNKKAKEQKVEFNDDDELFSGVSI